MKSFFRKGISILVMLFMAISQFAMYPQVVHAATYTWQSLNGSQSFSDPLGVAKDSQGNMYVTDEGNGNIEELKKSSGTWVNIPGPQGLTDPGSIAVDSSGNLYVAGADSNAKIWELPVGGSWTDITNGATIWNIDGIAVDNSGNVYLTTEQGPDYILKLPNGSSTWVSIEGTNDFTRPYGICTDSIGNVYVADRTSNKVGKLSNGSSIWVDIGTSTDGIDSPTGVAVDSQNNLYVCSSANGSIIEFNGSNWTTINNNAPLASVYGVVLDSNNDIYATAEGNPGLYKWAQVAAPTVTAVSPSSGSTAGGDTVTITGTGFTGATGAAAVEFGGTAATSYTVVSDTEITAISPAGSAGNVDITVTTAGGTSTTGSVDQFTYNTGTSAAAPTVTAVSPSSGSTAGGTTVTITGTGFTGATAVQFGSTVATNYTVDSDTQITATVPAGSAGAVDITVITPNGTSSTSTVDQYTYNAPSTSGSGICFTGDSPQIDSSAQASLNGVSPVTITDGASGNVLQVDDSDQNLELDNAADYGITTPSGMQGNFFSLHDTDSWIKFSVQGGKTFDFNGMQLQDGEGGGTYGFAPNGDISKIASFTLASNESRNIDLSSNPNFKNVNSVTLLSDGGLSCCFDNISMNIYSTQTAAPTVTAVSPSSGTTLGGTTVTITGTGFTGATAVNFGGTAATSYTVVSDTEITATAPAGTGTVDTTVTTANGTSSTSSADKYTYTATVTYDGNTSTGGTAPTDSASYAQNDTVTLLGNTGNLSKSGYSFAGWNTKADGTGTNYAVGNTFSMGTANVTLYAKWTANTSSEGGGSSSSGVGYIPPSTPTTVTGEVVDDKGDSVKGIPAQVTTDTNGTETVEVKAQDAILFKQADGTSSTLSDLSKLSFSTPDTTGAGTNAPSVTLKSDGTIQVNNLANGCETNFNVTMDLGNGQTIIIGKMDVKVSQAGDVSLTSTLIDPYGVITDASTGQAIAGADVTLYYADTARNKAAGKTPNTMVELPSIDGFEPNNNNDPQISDATGEYGWMVFPNTDYYIVATKDGYEKYTSPTISVEQEIVKWDFQMTSVNESPVSVSYIEHVQHKGWLDWVSDGQQAGTTGQCLRGEALKIELVNAPEGAHIEYQAHVQDKGWLDWVSDGQQAGTTGQYLRLEAIKITLENMPGYSVEYQVHVQDKGWMDWVSDGQQAGTTGQRLRLEAIRIKIVKNSSSD
jgi:uncharacterized repeat protein (TIGR02543 family)